MLIDDNGDCHQDESPGGNFGAVAAHHEGDVAQS